jgi:hypothetical protein
MQFGKIGHFFHFGSWYSCSLNSRSLFGFGY